MACVLGNYRPHKSKIDGFNRITKKTLCAIRTGHLFDSIIVASTTNERWSKKTFWKMRETVMSHPKRIKKEYDLPREFMYLHLLHLFIRSKMKSLKYLSLITAIRAILCIECWKRGGSIPKPSFKKIRTTKVLQTLKNCAHFKTKTCSFLT